MIKTWHDRRILAGDEWDGQIDQHLQTAQVILLLISSDFLASRYCWDVEVTQAMARHEAGNACVIPVILRDVDWKGAPFGKLQALPTNAQAVTSLGNQDAAFKDVAQGIRRTVEQIRSYRNVERQPRADSVMSPVINEYQQAVLEILAEDAGDIDETSRIILDGLRDRLSLSAEATAKVEQDLLSPYFDYEQTFKRVATALYPLDERARKKLQRMRKSCQLSAEVAVRIEQRVLQGDDELRSAKGVDYTKLRWLLKIGDWKAADYETYLRMLEVVGRKKGDRIRKDELLNFPCADLLTIDGLWVKYSEGRFGFSVQQRIYVECGGTLDGEYPGEKILSVWRRAVGWRHENLLWIQYGNVTFNITAPRGHLPHKIHLPHTISPFYWEVCWFLLSHPDLQSLSHKGFERS